MINLLTPCSVAITTLFIAYIGILVTEVMFRTVPGFISFAVANGLFIRIICRLADFAVPKAVAAFFVKDMRSVALRTIPAVIAVRFIGSRMMR